jgi:hypothetical protein
MPFEYKRHFAQKQYGARFVTQEKLMPRKAVLSAAQQAALIASPSAEHDLRLHYTLSENDLAIIRSKRL